MEHYNYPKNSDSSYDEIIFDLLLLYYYVIIYYYIMFQYI